MCVLTQWWESFHDVYVYEIIMLYTKYSAGFFFGQLYLNKSEKVIYILKQFGGENNYEWNKSRY